MVVKEGELLFAPKGSTYSSTVLTEGATYTAIHFEADFAEEPKMATYTLENFPEAEIMANSFSDMWNFGSQADRYTCLSMLYNLLSYLSIVENTQSHTSGSKHLIAPAIDYLKKHIYDNTLKIDHLPGMCGISDTYFRKLFREQYGMTPQSYVLSKRLSHAHAIIRSGDFNTIGEVATIVGFNDPLYFSKAFKKAYGMSPTDVNTM